MSSIEELTDQIVKQHRELEDEVAQLEETIGDQISAITEYLDALTAYEDATRQLGGVCEHSLIALTLRQARQKLEQLTP